MSDPVAFATARLDEDERFARDAADPVEEMPGSWRYDEQAQPVPRIIGTTWESSLGDGVWNCDDPDDHCDELRHPSRSAGEHIARHDPARVLREVEAGRRILKRHRNCGDGYGFCGDGGHGGGAAGCSEMEDLLVRWADHPDYDQDWKP